MLVGCQFCDLEFGRSRRGIRGIHQGIVSKQQAGLSLSPYIPDEFKRRRSCLKSRVLIVSDAWLQGPRAPVLLVTASRFVFISRRRRVFLRRAFEADDFNGFLINPFKIFRLEPVQTTRANMRSDDLLDGLAPCFIQFLEGAQGMC